MKKVRPLGIGLLVIIYNMKKKIIPESAFIDFVETQKLIIAKLESFQLPKLQSWLIDWQFLKRLASSKPGATWDTLPVYQQLLENKSTPGVYFFTIEKSDSSKLFKTYQTQKALSATIAMDNGVKAEGFSNISHVPKVHEESDCLYVGSRKANLHERFKQHLGFGSNRTGALHLSRVLTNTRLKPEIIFNYYLLRPQDKDITEKIESVIQKHLRPIIGKGILND